MSIETTFIFLVFYRVLPLNQTIVLHTDRYKSIMHVILCPGYFWCVAAGDRTRNLPNPKRTLYHYTTWAGSWFETQYLYFFTNLSEVIKFDNETRVRACASICTGSRQRVTYFTAYIIKWVLYVVLLAQLKTCRSIHIHISHDKKEPTHD